MATGRTHRRGRGAAGARQDGFTLIEMAIATAIFGLLASGAIMATSAWLGKQALDRTNKNLDRIESALTLYVVQNGRLPCPYDPTAAAGIYVGANCTGAGEHFVGVLPYRILGLQRTDVIDGWNRYLTYAVDADWTGDPTAAPGGPFFSGTTLQSLSGLAEAAAPAGGSTGADALLDVRDAASEGAAEDVCKPAGAPAPTRTAICAGYVLVSHGEDGDGALLAFGGGQRGTTAGARAEIENSDGDDVFAAEAFTDAPSDTQFGHILRYRTPAQILRDAL
ncbi:type II secretion system protein [Novispirillum sp. DQ9]|uniref:type II secretion system protein n=1 Tax=Novispirillum sp. DQ9 TaxID=3398612 RepID=UPI003C7B86A5